PARYRKYQQRKHRKLGRNKEEHGKIDNDGDGLFKDELQAVHDRILNLGHIVGETRYQVAFPLVAEKADMQPRHVAINIHAKVAHHIHFETRRYHPLHIAERIGEYNAQNNGKTYKQQRFQLSVRDNDGKEVMVEKADQIAYVKRKRRKARICLHLLWIEQHAEHGYHRREVQHAEDDAHQ